MRLPVFQSRVLPTLTAVAAVLVAALLLASLPARAQADPFCLQKRMNIVAHQDDDLIFQSPDLLEAIAAGVCVRTVFVTAGDAGLGEAYWREREEGSRAAYAVMGGVANNWTKSEATVAGHSLHIATLTNKPTVSQVYMRLPNGGSSGAGYAATGFKSLPKLWRSKNPEPASLTPISELSALDGSATYTYEGLLATLEGLIAEFEPEVISTQDFIHEFGSGDHADHITVAKMTRLAANAWPAEHVLRSYMDYESKNFPVNVFEPQLAKKLNAYYAYAAHDSNEACASQAKCEEPFYADYWAWLKRQIVLSETSVPGADAGPDQAVASKAAVTLDGSGSSDPLGHSLSYEWKQTSGTAVTLSNSKAVKPTFTAPTGPASLTFSLVVKSSEASSAADSVTVSVAAPKFALKVTRSGNGTGTVTSSPAGIECGSDCEESYEQGTKVTLSPTPAAGSEFKGWSGACTGSGACEVTMSAAKTVGAEFVLVKRQLSVSKSGTGSGTVTSSPAGIECGATCTASFDHGTLVKLSGTPSAGSKAVTWSGCDAVNASNQCEVTMSAAKAVTATFNLEPHQLTVAKNGSGTGTVTSSPAGINCGSECSASFNHGTVVKLSGAPGPNTKAVVWESCPGTVNASNQCEVTMSAAKEAKATFNLEQRQLTVERKGNGAGTVTSSPAGIECGATCAANFDHGTEVTLSASPASGSEFKGWSGACSGVGTCKVTMSAAKSVGAEFALVKRQLTVSKSGTGSGTVSSSPAGIECGATCTASFDHGTLVKLTGTPTGGSKAVAWSGCDAVNVSNQCEVTMEAAEAVTATFNLEPHQLTVAKNGSGTGTVTSSPVGINCGSECSASFLHGTLVKLSGAPGPNTKAVGWESCPGTVNTSNQCEVTMSAAKEAVATFNLEQRQLTVAKNGSGTGTVTSSPVGINCGATCSASYDHGTLVTLTGAPGANTKAVVWQTCPGTVNASNQCEVTMSAAKEAKATFSLEQRQLSVERKGNGSGTVASSPAGIECGATCGANFDHGTLVKLTGTPSAGSKAVAWSGCDAVNASNQCEVAMSAARKVEATFTLETHLLSVSKSGTGTGTVTSSPAGIECGATCSASFDHGIEVTLTVSPAAGSEFKGWSGACTGTGICKVTMSAAKSVGAEFALEKHQLTVSKSGTGTGTGTVASSPAGIECGTTCAASFDHGTLVKLTGAPGANTKAVVWESCPGTVNASNQCEVTMSAAREAKARFDLEQRQLIVAKNGSGSGTVTSSPGGISCGSECSASYVHGTLVKLTGVPAEGSQPVSWSGCDKVNGANECEVTMSAARSVTATFDLESHLLSVEEKGNGSGTVSSSPTGIECGATCAASYDHGTLVKLTGAPAAGSKAVAWSGCDKVNGSNECEVTMGAAKSVAAAFDLESHLLSIEEKGNGSGTVTSTPSGIECGGKCSSGFLYGTLVKLTGTPTAGSKAVAWSGCDTVNGSNQCEVTMEAARKVEATFILESHLLTVSTSGAGAGTVTSSPAGIECGATCSASFDHGTKVTLTGTPGLNTKAVVWESCPGTVNASNQCEVTMSVAKEAKARFDLESHSLRVEKKGSGAGTVTSSPTGISCGSECSASYVHGTLVKLTGASAEGSQPVSWGGCDKVNGANECEVTMDAAKEVKATFNAIGQFQLEVTRLGNGSGTVTSSPGGIECGSECEATFSEATLVKLSGTPATGSKSVIWSGCDAINGANECEVTMSASREVEATFTLESHLLTVSQSGTGSGTVISSPAGIECGAECSASFLHGTAVTLTPSPAAGSEFKGWSGACSGVGTCKVTMSSAKVVGAQFAPVEQTPLPEPPPPTSPTTPNTKLLKSEVKRGKVIFVFAAQGGATRFHCALARVRKELKLKYKRCASPTTYRNLAPGRYVFKVKAIGPGGIDRTPATRRFKVPASAAFRP